MLIAMPSAWLIRFMCFCTETNNSNQTKKKKQSNRT